MHDRGGYFIFGYLLVAFAMWKWQAPVGRKLSVASGGRLAMRFEPWKSRADSSNISFNNAAFEQWYNDLINATHRRIPRPLINKHVPKLWFGMNRDHTFVRPRGADPKELHTVALPYYMDEYI